MSRVNSLTSLSASARWSLLGILAVLSVTDAYAYIDPGTGSMLIQMGIAAIAGAMFFFRQLRMQVTDWFRRVVLGRAADPASTAEHASQDTNP